MEIQGPDQCDIRKAGDERLNKAEKFLIVLACIMLFVGSMVAFNTAVGYTDFPKMFIGVAFGAAMEMIAVGAILKWWPEKPEKSTLVEEKPEERTAVASFFEQIEDIKPDHLQKQSKYDACLSCLHEGEEPPHFCITCNQESEEQLPTNYEEG
jgi:hypothetical protein